MPLTETEIYKEECDFCDGCGWYEGGPTLMTTCEKCGGLGYIEKEREIEICHKWVIGEWVKEDGHRYYVRDDKCSLCGCGRGLVKSSKNANDAFVAHYDRSKQIFAPDNVPLCWGGKEPQ
jgi:DnaJ-class molecular chaperone